MTKYDESIRENVFVMYGSGVPIERISNKTGVARKTIYEWIKRYDWKSRKKEVQQKTLAQSNETVTQIKTKQHQINRGILGRFLTLLNDKKINPSVSDAVTTMKHDLLLYDEPETSVEIKGDIFDEIREELKKRKKKK